MNQNNIKSDKEMVHMASDLLDSEAQDVLKVVEGVRRKYNNRPNTVSNLEAMRDEILTKLTDIEILATVDPTPAFYGDPPVVEIMGKISTSAIHKHGVDHEQKGWEVNKANERKEEFYGQKESVNSSTKTKKRSRNG